MTEGKELPSQSGSKYLHLFYQGIDDAKKKEGASNPLKDNEKQASSMPSGPEKTEGAPDPWGTEDLWGDDLPGDVVEQCILMATQTVPEEPKTSERMMALQKSASAKVDKRLAEISSASGPLPPLSQRGPKKPYMQPFRKDDRRPDVSVLQVSGHTLMGRVQEVLNQSAPYKHQPLGVKPPTSPEKLTSSQRKLAAPTKSLPMSSACQATTDWLRSQLEKSSTECEVLKKQIQSKDGESKVLRDKLQSAEREVMRQKQEKMREIENIKKQTENRVKELEKKLNVAETEIMFKNKQREANLDMYMQMQHKKPEQVMHLQRTIAMDQPSTSGTGKQAFIVENTPLHDTEIYEVETQCSSEDEAEKIAIANFDNSELVQSTMGDEDMFAEAEHEKVGVKIRHQGRGNVENMDMQYLLDSDSEDFEEELLCDLETLETDSGDDICFKLEEKDMGKLLGDHISPELYVPSKVELNFIIAPPVDYDPHRLLYMDFSELIYDEYSNDPSKTINIWDENPNYAANPAIQPHYLKELKPHIPRDFGNNTDLMENILEKEMTQLESEMNERGINRFLGKETNVINVSQYEKERSTEKNSTAEHVQGPKVTENKNLFVKEPKQTNFNENVNKAQSIYFTTLEGIHVPLLRLTKAKLWTNENLPEMKQIVDHIRIMGSELFNAICDPRHLNFINRKTLEAREKEIATYFNKETHELDLLSHKPLNEKEKYVDFRRALALLALLCNICNSFGKLLVKYKLPPSGSEVNDLEFWKTNHERPAKRVDKYMKILYDNNNSEYKTKEIDGRINLIQLDKSEIKTMQNEWKHHGTEEDDLENIEIESTNIEKECSSTSDEVDTIIQQFEKLYNDTSLSANDMAEPRDSDCDSCNENVFNLWEYIQNPDKGLHSFSDPNGPIIEMIELNKEIEKEFNKEGKELPKEKEISAANESVLISFNESMKDDLQNIELKKDRKSIQKEPDKSKSVLEEIANETLEFWEKSHKCEVDPRFNDEVLPFLEPELYTGEKVTEAEKSIAGMVLGHHKVILTNVKDVMADVKEKFGDYVEGSKSDIYESSTDEYNNMELVTQDKELPLGPQGGINNAKCLSADTSNLEHLIEGENVDRIMGSSEFRFPSAHKSKRDSMDIDEDFEYQQSSKSKGKKSDKFKPKSSKKLKVESNKSPSSSKVVSSRSEKIMALLDPQPSTSSTSHHISPDIPVEDNIPETKPEEGIPKFHKFIKIPAQPSSSTKKMSLSHSSHAFLARKRAHEHLPEIDEEVEKEIDRMFGSKEKVVEISSIDEKKEDEPPVLDCPKTKIDVLEEFGKFQNKKSTLQLLEYIYEIVCSIGNMRLTLNFNPLFSSIVELIRALFSSCVERFHTDIIDLLMLILREILYCFPSPSVILQIQVTLVTAIKFERVVHQLCHNPSLKMSYIEKQNLRFYKGVCFIQVFCFLMTNLKPHKVKIYWDIAFYMLRWIYGMYTLHFHIVDAKWYRKYTNDEKDNCKCVSAFHILLFKVLSKCSFYYNLYSDDEKDMDELTKEKIEEMMLSGVNLADIIVANDPHFASHMKKRYQEYSGFLKTLMLMHNDKIVLPPFELAKVQLLLKEEEVIGKIEHDSSRTYDTEESHDLGFFTSQIQDIIFFSEVEQTNAFNGEKFRDSLKKPFDVS